MISSILVLCEGNICRSPMVEIILKNEFPNIHVHSAGLNALVNKPADPIAVDLMKIRGLDITGHLARQVSFLMVRQADLILVMTDRQKEILLKTYPFLRGKVNKVCEHDKRDVQDPYRQGESAFLQSLSDIDKGLEKWICKLKGNL